MERRQLGDNYCYGGKAVDKEICQAVIGIVGADKEQHNGDTEKELLGRGILVTVVDLLPHVEVVIGTRVEVKGDTADIVEHEVGAGHVREIDEGPGCFLGHAWDDIKQDLAEEDEDKVDSPCTLCIDPFDVEIGQCRLVAQLLKRLRGFLVDKTTATSAARIL